ncbi:MAG: DUF996 domain-containing protein [Thermoproteus sp. AZ2]|jgi:uncharacterized membrane protein|uniref:DUF996 domain-containing protein n=1 Tax=Thermoproteus sp. AZ2 TaxID=1609232 RepID=A0ACC6V079_9CREN
MEAETAKILAGVGAVLSIVGPFGYGIVGIIGLILVLVGLLSLADYFKDSEMRQNTIYWLIFAIIGVIALVATFVLGFFALSRFVVGPHLYTRVTSLTAVNVLALIAGLVVAEVFFILAASRLRRVYAALAQRTGEGLFNTAGTLYFWGAVLTIVLVGLILLFVSWILAAVAFFSAKLPPPPQ